MSLPDVPSRRSFLKTFVFGTAFAAILGQTWRRTYLAEAVPALPDLGLLQIKLSEYPILLSEFGSIRIGLNGIADDSSGPLGFFYPIIINRDTGDRFYALDAGCQHAGCVVPPYDSFEGLMICPCHGSSYAIDGTVVVGPAANSLVRFPIQYDGIDTLSIQVPFLGYSITASPVESTEHPRLRLEFQTRLGVNYEVRFRPTLQAPWVPVPFASEPDSPADLTSLVGNDLEASVYVDRPGATGFFSVVIQILDLTSI